MECYDIVNPEEDFSSYEISLIENAIVKFSSHSPIPIKLLNLPTQKGNKQETGEYDEARNIHISNLKFGKKAQATRVFFRGQEISGFSLDLNYASADIDLYGRSAVDTLTYSRDNIRSNAYNEIRKDIEKSLCKLFEYKFDSYPSKIKKYISAFLLIHGDKIKHSKYLGKIKIGDQQKISLSKARKTKNVSGVMTHRFNQAEVNDTGITPYSLRDVYLLTEYLNNHNIYIGFDQRDGDSEYDLFRILSHDEPPICIDKLRNIISNSDNTERFYGFGCRLSIPAWGKYSDPILRDNVKLYTKRFRTTIWPSQIILPYKFLKGCRAEIDLSDQFLDWVHKNLKNKEIDKPGIANLYQELQRELEEY